MKSEAEIREALAATEFAMALMCLHMGEPPHADDLAVFRGMGLQLATLQWALDESVSMNGETYDGENPVEALISAYRMAQELEARKTRGEV